MFLFPQIDCIHKSKIITFIILTQHLLLFYRLTINMMKAAEESHCYVSAFSLCNLYFSFCIFTVFALISPQRKGRTPSHSHVVLPYKDKRKKLFSITIGTGTLSFEKIFLHILLTGAFVLLICRLFELSAQFLCV